MFLYLFSKKNSTAKIHQMIPTNFHLSRRESNLLTAYKSFCWKACQTKMLCRGKYTTTIRDINLIGMIEDKRNALRWQHTL